MGFDGSLHSSEHGNIDSDANRFPMKYFLDILDIKIVFLHKDITEEEAFKWERYWIKYIGRRDLKEGSLCNLTDGGEGDSGYTHSDESRKKMSKALKGRTPWNKGKKMSKEYCKRNSEAHKGLRTGEDHPMYGKTHTDEAKRKVSIANKGKPAVNKGKTHTKEAKKKMRGRIVSEETREKIRKTKRARSILNKNRNK